MSNVCLLRRPETSATATTIICNGIKFYSWRRSPTSAAPINHNL